MMKVEGKLTSRDRTRATVLKWAPWFGFFAVALPFPILFLLLYLGGGADSALYILLTLTSMVAGSVAGLIAAILLFLYRKRWLKRLRERLAANGITANDLPWFMPELSTAERQSLKSIDRQSPLLADAFRETLASRIMATRLVSAAKREMVVVDRRLNKIALIREADTSTLQQQLKNDKIRLEKLKVEGSERKAEAEARLQMIEAAASRNLTREQTSLSLERLGTSHSQLPLALQESQLEQEARDEVDREIHQDAPDRSS